MITIRRRKVWLPQHEQGEPCTRIAPGTDDPTRCNWVLAALGLIMSAAGTAMSMKANSDARAAQDDAKAAELYRQSQFQKKAQEIVNQQIAKSDADTAVQDIKSAATKRAADYNRITSAMPTRAVTKTVTPGTPMAAATSNQNAMAAAWNKILGGAQAKLGAYGDWGLARNIAQQRGAQDIGMIGGDARRSAEISAAEQQDAAHSADGLAAGGQLVSAVGGALGSYGAGTGWGASQEEELVQPENGYGWR